MVQWFEDTFWDFPNLILSHIILFTIKYQKNDFFKKELLSMEKKNYDHLVDNFKSFQSKLVPEK